MKCSKLAICRLLCGLLHSNAWSIEPVRVADGIDLPHTDWPWWRGPLRNGTADAKQTPPTEFGPEQNVIWRAEVPGRGYGSPTVVGTRVFLATCDEASGSQSLMCFSRETGEVLWSEVVHSSGAMRKNNKSTGASSTPACDGERVFINFPNNGGLYTTALDLEGRLLWQQRVSSYVMHQGYGASPALYQNLVIASADNKAGGAIVGMSRETGAVVWRRERPQKPNYPTPTLLHTCGKDQLIQVGCDSVMSYDPLTGNTNWEMQGATTECVTSTITNGTLVYTSGGYPKNHMSAIRADGSGEVVWENKERLYVPSLVILGDHLYGILDAGITVCWQADSGKELWKKRLGGTFSASPVLVGDQLFMTNEEGDFFVLRANPDAFELLAKNQLGQEVFATPTIVGSRIYHRVAHRDASGLRQEVLYCLGQPR